MWVKNRPTVLLHPRLGKSFNLSVRQTYLSGTSARRRNWPWGVLRGSSINWPRILLRPRSTTENHFCFDERWKISTDFHPRWISFLEMLRCERIESKFSELHQVNSLIHSSHIIISQVPSRTKLLQSFRQLFCQKVTRSKSWKQKTVRAIVDADETPRLPNLAGRVH